MKQNPIILAVDVHDAKTASTLTAKLAPHVGAFKVGMELFTSAGPDVVRAIRDLGASVVLDLKFLDIPNTVAKAVANAVRLGVKMLTIHTSGGLEMMRAAENSAQNTAQSLGIEPPVVLGVTVLTSLDGNGLAQIGVPRNPAKQVELLAKLAVKAGLRGLVCSPLEIASLRKIIPSTMQLVTPGIRTSAEAKQDQKRTLSAREAMDAGANWLVVGRPIYQAADPVKAAQEILATLN